MKTKREIWPVGYRTLSDEVLVERFVQMNEQQAIHLLFERYGHLVFGLCCRYLEQPEAAESAMRQIFTNLSVDLRNINLDNFRNWLIQTTKNYCGTHLQQLSKTIPHSLISMPLAEQWSHQLTQPEEQIMLQCVTKAFKTLVPAQQECIRLFYLEKMNIEDIARSTGFSLTDVRAHIRIGKQIIRNLLNHNTN